MKKPRLFKLAAAALLVIGTLAAVSCKKEESETPEQGDTTGGTSTLKAVKGSTSVKIYLDTVYFDGSRTIVINDSILQIFDINVEVTAGNETKRGKLTGDSLILEAVTTTIPSNGQIKATLTPKASFKADTTKTYTFGFLCTQGYTTTFADGTESSTIKTRGINLKKTKGVEMTTENLEHTARVFAPFLGDSSTYVFKDAVAKN